MIGVRQLLRSPSGLVILAAIAVGLALRVLAARGGLWTDEAWSMVYAEAARTPAGVFWRINHDNNHHLYSLWLQAVGTGAAPQVARAPSIAAGTLTILLAAIFAGRRSPAAAACIAMLFAVSPMMVHIGSEARGYAPMLLAAMAMLVTVDRRLARAGDGHARGVIALLAAVGLLCHLTMLAAIGLLAAWTYAVWRTERGPNGALKATLHLFAPALAATALVLGLVIVAAAADPRGFSVGGYAPFSWSDYGGALRELVQYVVGIRVPLAVLALLPAALLALVWLARERLGRPASLYVLLLFGSPLAIALLQPGNASFARYYVLSGVGLLLLAGDLLASRVDRPGVGRTLVGLVLAGLIGLALWRDTQLLEARHGDPDVPVAIIHAQSPAGATIALASRDLRAVVSVAARRRAYALREAPGCAPADYLLEPLSAGETAPADRVRCGRTYHRLAWRPVPPLSGRGWALYAERPLAMNSPP